MQMGLIPVKKYARMIAWIIVGSTWDMGTFRLRVSGVQPAQKTGVNK